MRSASLPSVDIGAAAGKHYRDRNARRPAASRPDASGIETAGAVPFFDRSLGDVAHRGVPRRQSAEPAGPRQPAGLRRPSSGSPSNLPPPQTTPPNFSASPAFQRAGDIIRIRARRKHRHASGESDCGAPYAVAPQHRGCPLGGGHYRVHPSRRRVGNGSLPTWPTSRPRVSAPSHDLSAGRAGNLRAGTAAAPCRSRDVGDRRIIWRACRSRVASHSPAGDYLHARQRQFSNPSGIDPLARTRRRAADACSGARRSRTIRD